MNNYNPNIHHRKSIRLRGYDYSKTGLYYITICTYDRKWLFGKIVPVGVQNFEPLHRPVHRPQKMILNDAGNIVNECWLQIPEHFPNVFLHEHVVMPNHIHGIVEIVGVQIVGVQNVGVQNFEPLRSTDDSEITVGVEIFEPLQENFEPLRNEYQKIIPHSIGSIVRGFKIGVTKWR